MFQNHAKIPFLGGVTYDVISLTVERTSRSNFKIKNQQYNYSEVVQITDNFKTIIGEGGFGKVYLGILEDETQVAVKLLSPSSKQGYKEFRAEVRHRSAVILVNYLNFNLVLEVRLHERYNAGTTLNDSSS